MPLIAEIMNEVNVDFEIAVFGNGSVGHSFTDIMKKYKPADVERFQCTQLASINEPAFIEYTSGSTGLPKGALHSHKSLFGNIMIVGSLGSCNEILLCYSNLCWITGVLSTLCTIAQFQTRIVAKAFEPENLCQLVEKYKVYMNIFSSSI